MRVAVGIDVACAKGKLLPFCVGGLGKGRFWPLRLRGGRRPPRSAGNRRALDPEWCVGFAREVVDYLRDIEREHRVFITSIGLDAPAAPRPEGVPLRASEAALRASKISFFQTPSRAELDVIVTKAGAHLQAGGSEARIPYANKLWMLVGFALFSELSRHWECIEVYPQATVRGLHAIGALPPGTLHKSAGLAALEQLRACSLYSGWPFDATERAARRLGYGALNDRVDAYLAAYTAALPAEKRIVYGEPPHDAIWAPDFARLPSYDRGCGRPAAEEIDLTEEDEAILDAAWDTMAAKVKQRS